MHHLVLKMCWRDCVNVVLAGAGDADGSDVVLMTQCPLYLPVCLPFLATASCTWLGSIAALQRMYCSRTWNGSEAASLSKYVSTTACTSSMLNGLAGCRWQSSWGLRRPAW